MKTNHVTWRRDMKLIKVKKGVNRIPEINEPTEIISVAEHPWDAIIAPEDPSQPAIHVNDTLVISGCTIRGGSYGIKGKKGFFGSIYIRLCNILLNSGQGVYANGPLMIRYSLIERNGTNAQFNHGVYPKGDTVILNSIIWDNVGDQISHGGEDTKLTMRWCLIGGGHRSFSCKPANLAEMHRCTYEGTIYAGEGKTITPDRSNLRIQDVAWPASGTDDGHRVFWPPSVAEGRGCYDYDPRIEAVGMTPYKYATTLWEHGDMYAFEDRWGRHPHPWPHWPGEEIPGLTEFLAGLKANHGDAEGTE